MAKRKIDGIAIGEQLRQEMTDTWLKSALACFELADDKDAMNEFRAAFGRNPKHIIKAVERFPNIFHADNHPDLFDILAAILLSKVKDDIEAEKMYSDFGKNKDYDLLKDCIKEYSAENRAPRAKRKADAAGYDRMIILRAVNEWNNNSCELRDELINELVDYVVKAIDAAMKDGADG